jgi:hypothetical protein
MWQTFLLLALLPAQGKNEGQPLLQQMEEKLSKAKTLELYHCEPQEPLTQNAA